VLDGNGNVLATHAYGAGNQRLMSVEGGVTRYFAWDGKGQIIAEYEAWGTNALIWKTSYVYLGGRLLATTSGADGTETRFHHPDQLGTRLVTAPDGTVVTEQFTMPFGNMLPFTSVYGGENPYQNPTLANPSKKRFTTYDRSVATGMDYAVNRFYSPQQGRFTQVDPIGMEAVSLTDPQTLNLYSYCGSDPINRFDPDGLFFGKLFKWIGRGLKWLGIAVAVAVVIVSGPFAPATGSILGKILGVIVGIGKAVGMAANFLAGGVLVGEGVTLAAANIGAAILYGAGTAVGAVANHLAKEEKPCNTKLLRSGAELMMALAQDKIAADDIGDYECTFFDNCKEVGAKIKDLTRGVGIRRRDLKPETPSYVGHANVWAEQKMTLNRCLQKWAEKGCKDDDLPPGFRMKDAVYEAAAPAPEVRGFGDFVRRGGLIIPAILICTVNPAACAGVLLPGKKPGPIPVPAR
jgi:RHS repeat-associated protein